MAVAAEASLVDVRWIPHSRTSSYSLPQCEMSVKTMQLEKEYEKVITDSARLLDAEKDRVRRMEQLLLQFENESLRSQLDEANEQLLGLTHSESEACLQLDEVYQELDRLDLHVQVSSSEMQKLKVRRYRFLSIPLQGQLPNQL